MGKYDIYLTHEEMEQIEHYVETDLDYLLLNDKEKEKYKETIKNMVINKRIRKREPNIEEIIDKFSDTLEYSIEKFRKFHYSEDEAIQLAKWSLSGAFRQNYYDIIDFLQALGYLQEYYKEKKTNLRISLETPFARKMHLQKEEYITEQNKNNILIIPNKRFESKFGISKEVAIKKYPITQEAKKIIRYLALQTDEEIKEKFNLTRQELMAIFPTTLKSLQLVANIGKMKDEAVIKKYGMCKKRLFTKYPFDPETLRAFATVNANSEKVIESRTGESKGKVLMRRSLTIDELRTVKK